MGKNIKKAKCSDNRRKNKNRIFTNRKMNKMIRKMRN